MEQHHRSPRFAPQNHRLLIPTPPVNRPRSYRGLISSHGVYLDDSNTNPLKSSSTSKLNLPNKPSLNTSSSTQRVEMDSYSWDSGFGTLTQKARTPAKQIPVNLGSSQLLVHHTSSKGTQEGLLFPKYQADASSKCIMCKACGIFFSHDAFLRHLHDMYGKRVECYGQYLELAIDVPSKEQILVFQEFLTKLGVNQQTSQITGSHQTPGSPITRNTSGRSLTSKSITSPAINTWTRDIQETVLESEKLLQETANYLRTSAKKMQHRRKNSFQSQGLPLLSREDDDTACRVLPNTDKPNATLPVIKTHNSHRTSKKSLQKYFGSDQTSKREDKSLPPTTTVPKSNPFASLTSGSIKNYATSDKENATKFFGLTHTDDVLKSRLTDSLRVESLESRPSGSGDATSGLDGKSRSGFAANEVLPSNIQELPRLVQDQKNDPAYILQTAQDLITLASHKMQQQQQQVTQDTNADWLSKYEAEHALRLKYEADIKKLEGLLREEQKQRQELEIQLHAMRLQSL